MAQTHILGYPRIGARRELKFALEAFWRKEIDETDLRRVAAELKRQRWRAQQKAGLTYITAGDFAFSCFTAPQRRHHTRRSSNSR